MSMEKNEQLSETMHILGQELTGSIVAISNTTLAGKNFRQFAPIDESSGFEYIWYNSSPFQDTVFNLFSKALPDKLKRGMFDEELSLPEMETIQRILFQQISLLTETNSASNLEVVFDLRDANNFQLYNFKKMYDLVTNCLNTGKPV